MNFLVTNDDGIFASGVHALVEVLQHFGKVYVVCPDEERSAISHSITLSRPLKATKVQVFGGNVEAWAVNGTPADCIKLALEVLIKEPIDFAVSGMNRGANIGNDILYSGTISGAVEASLFNIKAIALSLDHYDETKVDYTYPKHHLYQLMEILMGHNWSSRFFLNINLPYIQKELCKGVAVVPLDTSVSRYKHVGINDPNGHIYYWLKDQHAQVTNQQVQGDFHHLREGYITITPLERKVSDKKYTRQIQKWFEPFNFVQQKSSTSISNELHESQYLIQ